MNLNLESKRLKRHSKMTEVESLADVSLERRHFDREKLTEAEVEQYDRQIRLWGLESQKKLRSSRVLVCGLTGVAAEVCKNIVLAGIRSLTILDQNPCSEKETGARFLFPYGQDPQAKSVSAVHRLQTLNPNVEVVADGGKAEDKTEEFFSQFDVICMCESSHELKIKVNDLCRKHAIKFYAAATWGYYGCYFVDLGDHEYVEEVAVETQSMDVEDNKTAATSSKHSKSGETKEEDKQTRIEKRLTSFCGLKQSLEVNFGKLTAKHFKRHPKTVFIVRILQEFSNKFGRHPEAYFEQEDKSELDKLKFSFLKEQGLCEDFVDSNFAKFCFGELSPVCAIVGGVLSQEMIKAITAKEEPFNNHFLYDGYHGNGTVELIG